MTTSNDSKRKIIIAFDAYGTLLSTSSIAEKLASHFGKEKASTLADDWRKYQLEYTWRINSMGSRIMTVGFLHNMLTP